MINCFFNGIAVNQRIEESDCPFIHIFTYYFSFETYDRPRSLGG